MSRIDLMNKLWRPFGAWGLAINLFFLPWAIASMAWFAKGAQHIPAMIGLVATLGGWYVALFAARQMGKNKAMETEMAIEIERINANED